MTRREYDRRYLETHREKVNAKNKLWRLSHPEISKLSRKKSSHKSIHGEPYEKKLERLERQDFRCANPGCQTSDPGKKGWHTDHDHETNQIRGELCQGCNRALGFLYDDVKKILGLAEYIQQYKK